MNVLRGTFRLSILVGVAALIYYLVEASQAAGQQAHRDWELWYTQRCGRILLGKDVTPYQNEYGNIDLGRVGCSTRQFYSNIGEIEEALKQHDPYDATWRRVWRARVEIAAIYGVLFFVLTNLLGFGFLGARRTYRWVSAGYRTGAGDNRPRSQ